MAKRTFGEPGRPLARTDLHEQMYRIVCGKGPRMMRQIMSRADVFYMKVCPLCGETCEMIVTSESEIVTRTHTGGMFAQGV